MSNKIEYQIAHVMANYGDDPERFLIKMSDLVIEWFCKGLASGIETERTHNKGKPLTCPHCQFTSTIYHWEWTAICCPECKAEIQRDEVNAQGERND